MDTFHFKQFSVRQDGCAMRVNTDGVLLAALFKPRQAMHMLDIGAGTGVISLICGQRFQMASIDAVEIDALAAETVKFNFESSPYANRLTIHPCAFQKLDVPDGTYDVIITNPPFFTNSLVNPDGQKKVARHTDDSFFQELINFSLRKLTSAGELHYILPVEQAEALNNMAGAAGLHVSREINICSFENRAPHRKIVSLSREQSVPYVETFVIYSQVKTYSDQYRSALYDYFTIFSKDQ